VVYSHFIGSAVAAVGKRVRSTSLYYSRQCGILFKPRSHRIDCSVVCFVTQDRSR